MLERIDLAMLPAEAEAMPSEAYIVVDVLRATTTIATLFAGGMTSLIAAGRLELARDLAAAEGRLLMGEVGGLPPAGFDFGNSPVEAAAAPVAGRGGVLFTTNGTAALCLLAGRGAVFAGAAANATALAAYVAGHFRSATIVCAGNAAGARFSLEDFAAGALSEAAPGAALGDAAALARHTPDLADLIGLSDHAAIVRGLGLAHDIDFASRLDTSAVVPMVVACGDGWARIEAVMTSAG
ncbi:MAG TPA: 2-phosphosulfolactate phosphatase [Tepidiformaceae bacterium]|nr:2-phosphosulfolactate phosphatase [Tepidiformaceae bacterium]